MPTSPATTVGKRYRARAHPEKAGPGHVRRGPERGAGAFREQGGDHQDRYGDEHRRIGPSGPNPRHRWCRKPGAAGGTRQDRRDGQGGHADEREDDDPDRPRYDIRRSARSPRNPMTPMTVPNTKETIASSRCTQKYAVG